MVSTLLQPITANTDHGKHNLPWAPHRLLPYISIFMIIYIHIFLVVLSTRATTKNATNISKLNKWGKLSMSVYIEHLV